VDGIISAAIFLSCNSKSESSSNDYRLYPVTSVMRGERFNDLFLSVKMRPFDKRIVVDYQYHKDADLWVDHHYDPEFGDCIIKNDKMNYSPKEKCAATLVDEMFERYFSFRSVDTLTTVQMIDSAGYPNVPFIFKDTSPLMVLRAYLEKILPSEMMYCRLVEVIAACNLDVEKALFRMRIESSHVNDLEKLARQIRGSMTVCNKLSIVNQKRSNQFPRYSEYLIRPELKYQLRFTPMGMNKFNFQIGFNNWQSEANQFNIGKMLMAMQGNHIVKGGGHFNVGAGVVMDDNIEGFIDEVSRILNEEDVMEKYSVDSTDSVEQKASELVKEGSAKNIDDARKTAAAQTKPATEDSDGVGAKGKIQ